MERFSRYEEEVLFEQKINEIQETNEFKLFAEGKIDKEEFKSFLIEAYGEELAEGFLADLGAKLKKLGLGAATIATLLAGAPADVKAAPSSPTTQVAASDDDRMQVMAAFTSNAISLRAAAQDDRENIRKDAIKTMKDFLIDYDVDQDLARTIMSEVMFKQGGVATARDMFKKHLEQSVRPVKPEREGGEEQSRANYRNQILATAGGDSGFDAELIDLALEQNQITDDQAESLRPLAGKANQGDAVENILNR